MKKINVISFSMLAIASLSMISLAQSAPTNIINNATVSSPTTDLNTANNSATTTDKLCYKADLAVTLSDSVTVIKPLSTDNYASTISNAGPSTVTELTYEFSYNTLDFSAFNSFSTTKGTLSAPTSTTSGGVTTVKYTITGLNLANTESLVVSMTGTATANPSASVNTNAKVAPTGPSNNDPACTMQDPTPLNNTIPDITSGTLEADLSIIKTSTGGSSSATGVVGSMTSKTNQLYTLTISNNGPSAAQPNIVIIDTIPAEVTPTNVTGSTCIPGAGSTAGLSCTYDSATRKMTFTLSTALPNGSNIVATVPVSVN
jgi:uncharacterized repeat protein (TIGR01451 family)